MADNTITLTLGVDDKGTAILRTFQTTTANTFNKIKGDSESLVDSVKKHWLGLTAAATATGLAINRAWGLAEMAAQFQEQKASLNALATQYGTSANNIISSIQTVSKGLVSMSDAVDIAGSVMAKGLSPDQIINLAGAAETLSNVTGQKVSDAFRSMADSIALGRSRGIEAAVGMIDLKDKYGDLVEKMSEAEKAQAMYAIVMERVGTLQKTLGEGTDSTADKMERLTVQIADLKLEAGAFVIKGGLALYGILQGTASAALFLTSGVFGIIAALAALSDKLGLTSGGFAKWRAEADAALAASEELAKKGKENLAAIFAAPEDLAGAAGGTKPPGGGGGGGGKDDLSKERLSFIKSLNSEILTAEQQHQDAWLALAIEYNAKEVEAKKLGKGAVLKVEEWYSAQASALLRKDGEDAAKEAETRRGKAIDELGQQNNAIASFYEKLAADTLSAQTELSGEYWALAVEFSAKEAELHAMGIDDKLALEEWYALEVDRINKKKEPGPVTTLTTVTQAISSPVQAISSGILALGQAAGVMTAAAGPLIGGALNLIQAVINLPGMITDFVKGLVKAALAFPAKLIELITDVVAQLPNLLNKIMTGLISAIPKVVTALLEAVPEIITGLIMQVPLFIRAIIQAIPQVIQALIKGIPKMIAALIDGLINAVNTVLDMLFGWIPGVSFGSKEQATPAWADENTQSMKDLTDSIDGLNDSINKTLTDMLTGSASPASAIDRLQVAWGEVAKFKEAFAGATGADKVEAGKSLQDALGTYLKVAQEAYQRPSTEYQGIFDTTVADLKAIQAGLAGINTSQAETSMYSISFDSSVITNMITKIFSDAWEGLKKIFSDAWEGLKNIFSDLWITIKEMPGKLWDAIKGLPAMMWDAIKGLPAEIWYKFTTLPGLIFDTLKGIPGAVATEIGNAISGLPQDIYNAISGLPGMIWDAIKGLPGMIWDAIKGLFGGGGGGVDWDPTHWSFHSGGMIPKAHDGLFLGSSLASYEVPIIAKVGEGILNDYNGMKAIGGEAGLNYANKTGRMMGGGSVVYNYSVSPQVTIHTKGEVDTASLVRQIVRATEDSLKYGKMKQIVNA